MFDAAIALLPEGSHFVMGAKLNHAVLPTASIAKAHSYMLDLNRVFMPDDVRLAHWVGEFYPSFDLWISFGKFGSRLPRKWIRW